MAGEGLIAAAREEPADGSVSDELIERVASTPLVLIGEATHGTTEFYALRAELTRRLIKDDGFDGVAIEGDWPDAAKVHRYVTGTGVDAQRYGYATAAGLLEPCEDEVVDQLVEL